jgi:hypothetical protein
VQQIPVECRVTQRRRRDGGWLQSGHANRRPQLPRAHRRPPELLLAHVSWRPLRIRDREVATSQNARVRRAGRPPRPSRRHPELGYSVLHRSNLILRVVGHNVAVADSARQAAIAPRRAIPRRTEASVRRRRGGRNPLAVRIGVGVVATR